jgi:hypothetical protein
VIVLVRPSSNSQDIRFGALVSRRATGQGLMKLTVMMQITVDGVVQGNGAASDEDRRNGFERGGWARGAGRRRDQGVDHPDLPARR